MFTKSTLASLKNNSLLRGWLTGTFIVLSGLASVGIFHFARSGEAWQQLVAGRLTPSTFFFQRGNYYFGGTDYNVEKALANFERALSFKNAYQDPIRYQIGRVYFIKGDLKRALEEFHAQLAENPDYKRTYYMRGLTYGYLNEFKQAEADFLQYLEWQPTSWAAHNDLVWVYFRSGQYQKAEVLAREGLQYAPKNGWLSNSLGAILINQERYAEARAPLLDAKNAFTAMGPEGWGVAYPGNNPQIYNQGFEATLQSTEDNLQLVAKKLAGNVQ